MATCPVCRRHYREDENVQGPDACSCGCVPVAECARCGCEVPAASIVRDGGQRICDSCADEINSEERE